MLSSTLISSSTISIWSERTGIFGAASGGGGVSSVIGTMSSTSTICSSPWRAETSFSLVWYSNAPRTTSREITKPISTKSSLLFSRLALGVFLTSISVILLISLLISPISHVSFIVSKLEIFLFNSNFFLFSCIFARLFIGYHDYLPDI